MDHHGLSWTVILHPEKQTIVRLTGTSFDPRVPPPIAAGRELLDHAHRAPTSSCTAPLCLVTLGRSVHC